MLGRGSTEERVAAIVLAAGGSSRMGRPKQLLLWRGKTLLQHVVDIVSLSAVDDIVIVLGAAAKEVTASLSLPPRARTVINEEYCLGQATSLRKGLAAASGARAAIIVLGDEPNLSASTIELILRERFDHPKSIIRTVYSGQAGHPVLLPREVWAQIAGEGDEGARVLIAARPDLVVDVPVGGGKPTDVDTPEDFDELAGKSPSPPEI